MTKQAFEGIKVASFGMAAVGPMHATYLAQHGATVVFVESRKVLDPGRVIPPFKDNVVHFDRGGQFSLCNVNQYSITVDMNSPKGIEVAKRVLAWADVMVEGWGTGALAKRGLSIDEIRRVNSNIIILSTSTQGRTGPRANAKGYGHQLTGGVGFTYLTGWPDRAPTVPFYAYTDFLVPRFGTAALIAALIYRKKTGKGQFLDLSQFEASLQLLMPHILDYTVNKRIAERAGNSCPYAAPHGVYRCKGEDEWCAITVFTDKEWQSFCEVLGSPDWTKHPKFATCLSRKRNEDELNKLVESWTIKYTPQEVMTKMQAAGVAAGVLFNPEELNNCPHLKERGYFQKLNHPAIGEYTYYGQAPFKLSKTPLKLHMPAPCLGEHTEYVCTHLLKMSDEEFVQLAVDGAFG